MKFHFLIIFFLLRDILNAQTINEKYLERNWKSYEADSISFTMLSIHFNGESYKAKGQTFAGKDSIFDDTRSIIYKWEITEDTLFGYWKDSPKKPRFKIEIKNVAQDSFSCIIKDLLLAPFKVLENNYTFKDAEKYKVKGAEKVSCIYELNYLHTDTNENYFTVRKDNIDNLVPYLYACKHGFKYAKEYHDYAWQMQIPNYLIRRQSGFGDYSYTLTFYDKSDGGSTIDIYYDFDGHQKKHFFDDIASGKNIVTTKVLRGKTIYVYKNWDKSYAAKIYMDNNIAVTYYTDSKKQEEELLQAILSFHFE